MTHVLVTGGAGFIGSHVTAALLAAGHQVRVLDSAHPAAHSVAPPGDVHGVPVLRADVRDRSAVDEALRGGRCRCASGRDGRHGGRSRRSARLRRL